MEELETEMTFGEVNRDETTSVGMNRSPNVATGVAFDNFDRFVETLSGKNTLHDTVGIAYQTCTVDTLVDKSSSNSSGKENEVDIVLSFHMLINQPNAEEHMRRKEMSLHPIVKS